MTEKPDIVIPDIVIIGGGSWGAAIASALCAQADVLDYFILTRTAETARALQAGLVRQLPHVHNLPPFPASDNREGLKRADFIYIVTPIDSTPAILAEIAQVNCTNAPIIFCGKGFIDDEEKGGILLTEYMDRHMPKRPFAVLTGPSFADEVLQGLPTAIICAGYDDKLTTTIAGHFAGSCLRIYQTSDVIGAGLGGAVKNVMAIALGIAVGWGFKDNARAALITRGLAEITRLSDEMGGERQTMYGLAGLGDFILSCSNQHSRNMAFGYALATSQSRGDNLVEGKHTVARVVRRARYEGVDMPICNAVNDIIAQKTDIGTAIERLLAREVGQE